MIREYTKNEVVNIYLDWFFNYQTAPNDLSKKYELNIGSVNQIISVGFKEHYKQVVSGERNETLGFGNKIIRVGT
jgi:hypothetical protein